MIESPGTVAYFDAVRNDDVLTVHRLLRETPELAQARWAARGNPDGLMRSLGPSPYNQHTWHLAPIDSDHPADPRYTSTPLHWTRNDNMVRVLVEHGADVNALGTSGDFELLNWFLTPLWRAAHDNRMESVRLLVEHGADVNRLNPDGSNQALKTAVENDACEVCVYLLAHGAQPDIITAAMLGLAEIVAELLASDTSLGEIRDAHGRSALDAATLLDSFRIRGTHTTGHNRVAESLIAHGSKMDLSHAASLGWTDEVRRILQDDPATEQRVRPVEALPTGGAQFETALAVAQRRGHTEIATILTQHAQPDPARS